ncbi:hypothetical protein C8R44DRAFT_892610 [Mycena epipterygia]|nr:hypothetical protein C8R44DRAFT_892610 [Mycena epipterygia]
MSITVGGIVGARSSRHHGILGILEVRKLRGDIVEALQCLKCLICRHLLFREREVIDLDVEDLEMDEGEKDDEEGWDCFLDEIKENYDVDVEMEDQ